MSSSIPIPIPIPLRPSSAAATLSDPISRQLGQSLPARPSLLYHSSPSTPSHPQRAISNASANPNDAPTPGAPAFTNPLSALDLTTMAPSVQLVSRTARHWRSDPAMAIPLRPWDFSELVDATDQVSTAFAAGAAVTKRPPRAGVSGTYFFCRDDEVEERKLGVFKPMDEEADCIDMSPPALSLPFNATNLPPIFDSNPDFSLGPAYSGFPASPACSPPRSAFAFHRPGSISSDSENDSRNLRVNGFQHGEGAYREVAAYLLDHDHFARVPQTALVRWLAPFKQSLFNPTPNGRPIPAPEFIDSDDSSASTPPCRSPAEMAEVNLQTTMGAFQVYVHNIGDADDFGPGVFDRDQVHRIAVLDIRTLNHDRHGGNILVAESKAFDRRYDIVPIDHGYILPDFIQSLPWPVWMDWPMIRQPLSDNVKRYIQYLDADTEARRLNDELNGVFRQGALQGLKIATTLLQKGVAAGLTLYDIGLLMYSNREHPNERSEFEKIVTEAEEASLVRNSHIEHKHVDSPSATPEDGGHHRRHQSIDAIDWPENFVDDFIVKYASRRIQEVVNRVAARKTSYADKWSPNRSSFMSRARSIPDFGIGAKPVHAILNCTLPNGQGNDVPAPTPATSPMAVNRHNMGQGLEAQLPPRPIQVPINDLNVVRISLPGQRGDVMGGNTSGPGVSLPDILGMNPDAIGATNGMKNGMTNGMKNGIKNGMKGGSSSLGLPPIAPKLPQSKRKASPVSAMETFKWGHAAQR